MTAAMTEAFLALVPEWGALAVGVVNFLACMALPIPASLVMLAAGAFVASGDIDPAAVWVLAILGACLGDQAGFFLGRIGGPPVLRRLEGRKSGRLVARARDWLERRRLPAVFLSRWLVSALGPYVNIAAGAARMHWLGFTLPCISGEIVWCTIYIGLGWAFSADIRMIGDTMGNLALALSAGVVAVLIGRFLWRLAREGR
ncbi:MAG: hypothetical protein RIR62_237 [Pseudomonadota bacterium]|jgi:membrane protein DedA with SNARE-associated domain